VIAVGVQYVVFSPTQVKVVQELCLNPNYDFDFDLDLDHDSKCQSNATVFWNLNLLYPDRADSSCLRKRSVGLYPGSYQASYPLWPSPDPSVTTFPPFLPPLMNVPPLMNAQII
jgi:hypothetical protein